MMSCNLIYSCLMLSTASRGWTGEQLSLYSLLSRHSTLALSISISVSTSLSSIPTLLISICLLSLSLSQAFNTPSILLVILFSSSKVHNIRSATTSCITSSFFTWCLHDVVQVMIDWFSVVCVGVDKGLRCVCQGNCNVMTWDWIVDTITVLTLCMKFLPLCWVFSVLTMWCT